jgi:endonuclease-3
MQLSFDLEAAPLLPQLRARLLEFYGPQQPARRMDPLSTLIKSVISSRTYDAVSWAAFVQLREAFPDWAALADTLPRDIEAVIAPVTHADRKARQLPVLIRVLQTRPYGLELGFLKDHIVDQAMAWLCELPGVGPQSAAKCLNFSTLNMRALAVDTHVHRVTRRLGLTSRSGDAALAYETLMSLIPPEWTAEDLYELHWLLKGLGQDICADPLALCGRCPLKDVCPRVDVEVRRAVVAFPAQSSRDLSQTANS